MTRRIRLITQILFFAVFLVLLVQTEYKGKDTLGQPVRFFLEIDPLLTLSTILSAKGFFLFGVGFGIALAIAVVGSRFIQRAFERTGADERIRLLAGRYLPLAVLIALLVWAVFPFGLDQGLPVPMSLGIATVLVTLMLGRVFCGWLCPMGTVHHFVGWLKRDKQKILIDKNQYQPSQRWKYMVLIAFLAAAFLGFQVIGILDPISLVIRSFSIVVSPLVNQIANGAYDLAYSTQNEVVIDVADWLYGLVAYPNILSFHEPHFMGAVFIGALFVFLLALNFVRPRYWCRSLCPLGAFLGTISRNSFYRLEINKEECIGCGRCHSHCQGACDPEHRQGWRPAECLVCYHCVDECPVNCLHFSFGAIRKETIGLDLKRRRALEAVAAGLVVVPLLRASEQYKTEAAQGIAEPAIFNPKLIRPPGAIPEKEFLQRCVRCGECMKVCPTNGLHPATLEAGVEGLWTPVLVPQIGYCEYYCTLCGQVCPTGAIKTLDVQTKIRTVIGTAFFDVNRCLPYAFGKTCIVCEEHCPTSPKAIFLTPVPRVTRDQAVETGDPYGFGGGQWASPTEQADEPPADQNEGILQEGQISPFGDDVYASEEGDQVLQPRIDLDLCIGCGICEKVCVVADQPAVYVTAVEEQRSTANRITLEGTFGNQ